MIPYNLDVLYDLLQVVLDLEKDVGGSSSSSLHHHTSSIDKQQLPSSSSSSLHKRKYTVRGHPLSGFTPRLNGPMNPGRKMRDGHRGGPTFEAYGCITSASEIGKLFGCLSKEKMHARVTYLTDRGLLEFETYKPKYKKVNMKQKPYWYTKLKVTDKGLKFMSLQEEMEKMLVM